MQIFEYTSDNDDGLWWSSTFFHQVCVSVNSQSHYKLTERILRHNGALFRLKCCLQCSTIFNTIKNAKHDYHSKSTFDRALFFKFTVSIALSSRQTALIIFATCLRFAKMTSWTYLFDGAKSELKTQFKCCITMPRKKLYPDCNWSMDRFSENWRR